MARYMAAVSVPKAVIVIVDTSSSMAPEGRMAAAKAATAMVIDTLGANDAIAVIDFDSVARSTTEDCLRDRMVPASAENKAKLKAFVSNIHIYVTETEATTSFDAAFVKADTILRDEVSQTVIGDKPVVVLFMAADGQRSIHQERVPAIIKGWSRDSTSTLGIKKPILLAFGFGTARADTPALDKIAQMSEGPDALATTVNSKDIRTSMAPYYQHQSLAHKPGAAHVAMTAPYIDSSGLGLVVTLSLPLYDEETKKLWGVAGIDVTLSDMIMPIKGMRYGNHGYGEILRQGQLLPGACCVRVRACARAYACACVFACWRCAVGCGVCRHQSSFCRPHTGIVAKPPRAVLAPAGRLSDGHHKRCGAVPPAVTGKHGRKAAVFPPGGPRSQCGLSYQGTARMVCVCVWRYKGRHSLGPMRVHAT